MEADKQEKEEHKHTPSFICEIPLQVLVNKAKSGQVLRS
jgi:hypothetical protein